jgi:FAD/FMN-containing dehydrogenase
MSPPMERLQRALRGPVLVRDHPAYEVARTTFNAMTDRHPAVIACCAGSDDVAAAVGWAQNEGLPAAIRGAGGATWRSVDASSAAHRLAMPGGTFDATGVAGLTLGGGIGHLMGLHGLTLDNLVSAEVVLADGTVVTASETAEPELFWALRGGGGNFGVVTEFEFALHPLPAVWGGIIAYPRPHMRDAIRLFRDVMAAAPDELTLMCDLAHAKVPGGAAFITVCFAGDAAAAEEAVRPLRESLPVLSDGLGLTSYQQIQVMQGDLPFGLRHYWKSHFVDSLTDDLIDEIVDHYLAHPQDGGDAVLIEPMHGAALRVPPNATAFSRREKCFNVSAMAQWEDDATDADHIAWARRTPAALQKRSASGGYLNYGAPDEPIERVRAAYGDANFQRLRQVKRRYDPHNLFRFNHNIPPAEA